MRVYCNCCGKQIEMKENTQTALEDYVVIEKSWGYFSDKDGVRQKMNICESCFDAWVQTFVKAPQETEEQELL